MEEEEAIGPGRTDQNSISHGSMGESIECKCRQRFPFYKTSDCFDSVVDEYRGGSDAAENFDRATVVFRAGFGIMIDRVY